MPALPRFVYLVVYPEVFPFVDLQQVRDWSNVLNWAAADEGYSVGPLHTQRSSDGSVLFYKVERPLPE